MIQDYLALHKRGFSLIPIQPDSKAYDKLAWQSRGYKSLADLKARGAKTSDIITWWREGTRKKRNVAIATNDHLCVVDFDSDIQYWRFVMEQAFWASTLTVKSPNGWHCYYRTQAAIPENTISIWPEVEIKHSGDCVLAPPSMIGAKRYQKRGIIPEPKTLPDVGALSLAGEGKRACNGDEVSFFRAPCDIGSNVEVPEVSLYRGIIQDIKSQLSVLDLASQHTDMIYKGSYHIGLCPVHNDTRPSFRVAGNRAVCAVPDCKLYDRRALDVIELHRRLCGLSYRDSIAVLGRELGLI